MRSPTVVLFSYTQDLEKVCAAAMRSCNSPCPAFHIYKGELLGYEKEQELTADRIRDLLQRALRMRHMSVLEHGLLTFDLQNVSRSLTHQLVRHRIASYTQQSQRHVAAEIDEDWYAVPPTFDKPAKDRFKERMATIANWYKEELNRPDANLEDTRFYLPNATFTNIVVSMNPRELLHFFSLRCAADAQWEIRAVAWAMLACSKLVAPIIFEKIPRPRQDKYVEEKESKLSEILSKVAVSFKAAKPQQIVEVPLGGLNLEYQARSFVNRI